MANPVLVLDDPLPGVRRLNPENRPEKAQPRSAKRAARAILGRVRAAETADANGQGSPSCPPPPRGAGALLLVGATTCRPTTPRTSFYYPGGYRGSGPSRGWRRFHDSGICQAGHPTQGARLWPGGGRRAGRACCDLVLRLRRTARSDTRRPPTPPPPPRLHEGPPDKQFQPVTDGIAAPDGDVSHRADAISGTEGGAAQKGSQRARARAALDRTVLRWPSASPGCTPSSPRSNKGRYNRAMEVMGLWRAAHPGPAPKAGRPASRPRGEPGLPAGPVQARRQQVARTDEPARDAGFGAYPAERRGRTRARADEAPL